MRCSSVSLSATRSQLLQRFRNLRIEPEGLVLFRSALVVDGQEFSGVVHHSHHSRLPLHLFNDIEEPRACCVISPAEEIGYGRLVVEITHLALQRLLQKTLR